MTQLLQQAIAEIEKLPEAEQDAIAARLLAELEDEKKWKARFDATTDDQWDRIAEMVRQEIAAGDITPLAEVFPPQQ
jgi:ribosome assembly protein YihI (activator of Der GTPase)